MLGIYCRTSRKESTAGIDTIEQQRKCGLDFARESNMDYIIYEDSGKSGYKEKSKEDPFSARPAFKELLAKIESGEVTEIWVWELSRLARKNKYYVQVIEYLAEHNIAVWVQNRKIDLSDPTQKAMVSMQGVFAELERMEIVERTQRGQRAAFDKGKCRHGSFYGYMTTSDKKVVPNQDELENIKGIFTDYLAGENLRAIGRKYFTNGNSDEVRELGTVRKISRLIRHEEYTSYSLKNSGRQIESDFEEGKIANLLELENDEHWVKSQYYTEAVIDRKTWIAAREKVENIKRRISEVRQTSSNRETDNSLGSGLLRCFHCGNKYYWKSIEERRGGNAYIHLRTIDKCSQYPLQFQAKKLDAIIDVLYTFYYLIFDNTEDRLYQMKMSVKDNSKKLAKELKDLEANKKQKTNFISNVEKKIAEGAFLDDVDSFKEVMKSMAIIRKQADDLDVAINLKKIEISENKKKEVSISAKEKYQMGTIDRLKKWFTMRNENNYVELRLEFSEILFDDLSIDGNIITAVLGDPGREFYLDITHDYHIVYPYIENLLGMKLDFVTYNGIEELYIEKNKDKINNFGSKVMDFINNRLDRSPEELFDNDNFLFLSDIFNCSYTFGGLQVFTAESEKICFDKVYTTEQVSEILGKAKSTLRGWAQKQKLPSVTSGHGKVIIWTDKDIENYKKMPHEHKGNTHIANEETRKLWSEQRRGKKHSEETKAKMREAQKKRWAKIKNDHNN